MTPVVLHRELASRVPELPIALIESYAASATPEYLDAYSLDDIAEHLRVIRQWGPLPLRLRISELRPNLFEVRIAARDYFSELAVIAGLLAAFGLNIEEGYLATADRYIVDIFLVRPVATRRFGKPRRPSVPGCPGEAQPPSNRSDRELTDVAHCAATCRCPV